MPALAHPLEAKAVRGQAEHVSKPWLKGSAASGLRNTESPTSVGHHLKAIAANNNQHFGEAWERSKKSVSCSCSISTEILCNGGMFGCKLPPSHGNVNMEQYTSSVTR